MSPPSAQKMKGGRRGNGPMVLGGGGGFKGTISRKTNLKQCAPRSKRLRTFLLSKFSNEIEEGKKYCKIIV